VSQSNLVDLKAWRKKGKKGTKRLLTYLVSLLLKKTFPLIFILKGKYGSHDYPKHTTGECSPGQAPTFFAYYFCLGLALADLVTLAFSASSKSFVVSFGPSSFTICILPWLFALINFSNSFVYASE
jgi:hypothetical protein